MNGYAFSLLVTQKSLFETAYTHAVITVYAENDDEATGKALRMAIEKYPYKDNWTDHQLSPAVKFISDLKRKE